MYSKFAVTVIADNTTVITPPSPQRAAITSCSQCGNVDDVHYRIDRLFKQFDNLEQSVSNDIKTILRILKYKNGGGGGGGGDFLVPEVSTDPDDTVLVVILVVAINSR